MVANLVPLLILGAVSAFTTYQTIEANKDAASARRKAVDEQRKRDNIRAARERAQAAREARIKRAQVVASGAVSGTGQSSSVVGGAGSVVSQGASTMNFIDRIAASNNMANEYMKDAATASSSAATYGALSNLSQQAFSSFGGYKELYNELT